MKLLYISLFALVAQSSFSYAGESCVRKFPHLGHLALGFGKLATGAACGWAGYSVLAAKGRAKSETGYLLLDALLYGGNQKTKSSFSEFPFEKDSYKFDSLLIAPVALCSGAYICFLGAYKCLASSKRSFVKAFSTEEVKKDQSTQEEGISKLVENDQNTQQDGLVNE